jgi:hypothetical protein
MVFRGIVVNLRCEHQPLRVHRQVVLSSLDFVPRIVAALFTVTAGGLEAPAIDDGGADLGIPPEAHPHALRRRSSSSHSQVPWIQQARKQW